MVKCIMSHEEVNSTSHYKISQYLFTISQSYSQYHPIVSLSLILIGISVGSFNLLILNFKKMVSPFNRMLSCIGIADMITMGLYAPFVIYFHIFNKCALNEGSKNIAPARFLYCYIVMTAVSHCASIWLAIGLSGLRLYCMKNPTQAEASTWRKMTIITTVTIILACSTSTIYVIYTKVELMNITVGSSANLTYIQHFSLNQSGAFVIGFHGVFVKLVPSALLTIIVIFIVKEFRIFKKRRKGLGKSTNVSNTTRMLIGVVFLFIILELPQGIVIFISALNHIFYREIYNQLGDIVDLMTIIRTVANFFIYCSMSSMFRRYLFEIVCRFVGCIRQLPRREPTLPFEAETIIPLNAKKTTMSPAIDTESEPEYCGPKDMANLLPSRNEARL